MFAVPVAAALAREFPQSVGECNCGYAGVGAGPLGHAAYVLLGSDQSYRKMSPWQSRFAWCPARLQPGSGPRRCDWMVASDTVSVVLPVRCTQLCRNSRGAGTDRARDSGASCNDCDGSVGRTPCDTVNACHIQRTAIVEDGDGTQSARSCYWRSLKVERSSLFDTELASTVAVVVSLTDPMLGADVGGTEAKTCHQSN